MTDHIITLAQRWREIADSAEKRIDGLDPDSTHAEVLGERALVWRKAADDLDELLRTGHVPHDLMTNEELQRYGTPTPPEVPA